MKTIYKYPFDAGVMRQSYSWQRDAVILAVGRQDVMTYVWVMLDTDQVEMESRTIVMYGTGWDMGDVEHLAHISTIFVDNGFVWHFFELLDAESASDA